MTKEKQLTNHQLKPVRIDPSLHKILKDKANAEHKIFHKYVDEIVRAGMTAKGLPIPQE